MFRNIVTSKKPQNAKKPPPLFLVASLGHNCDQKAPRPATFSSTGVEVNEEAGLRFHEKCERGKYCPCADSSILELKNL